MIVNNYKDIKLMFNLKLKIEIKERIKQWLLIIFNN